MPWRRALLGWTVLLAVLLALVLSRVGTYGDLDLSGILLLFLIGVWLAGVGIGFAAWAISRVIRGARGQGNGRER